MTGVKHQNKIVELLNYYFNINDKQMYQKYFAKLQKTNVDYDSYLKKSNDFKSSFVVHIQYKPFEQIIF